MSTQSNTAVARSLSVIVCVLLFPSISPAVELVHAEIEKESAWTGEAVPLIVKLFSPGTFSGTASFDLPDLPRTAFVQAGNPVVGSEEVDGESYFTQRHLLTLYTQRDGEIVIPAFRVRFSGKKSFTADPEPMEGLTPDLRFQSNRPPGTESMGLVVSATKMDIGQTWNPKPTVEIVTGDVIVRTIRRTAVGTTAMMLSAVPTGASDGIQVYAGTPEVQDKVDRGDARAQRTDTTKYQFQRAGLFILPELVFVWWDPQQEKLEQQTLTGLSITVVQSRAVVSAAGKPKSKISSIWTLAGLLAIGLVVWPIRKPLGQLVGSWQAHRNRPAARAVRKLRSACESNDPSAAYSALMSWFAIGRVQIGWDSSESFFKMEEDTVLWEQWQALSRYLYASESAGTTWQGGQFWAAFSHFQSRPKRESRWNQPAALPELNPSTPAGARER